jgi:hypothetical protein
VTAFYGVGAFGSAQYVEGTNRAMLALETNSAQREKDVTADT